MINFSLQAVLRIRGNSSRIRGQKGTESWIPDKQQNIKVLLTPNFLLSFWKHDPGLLLIIQSFTKPLEIWSGVIIPDPRSGFLSFWITNTGVKKALDARSGTLLWIFSIPNVPFLDELACSVMPESWCNRTVQIPPPPDRKFWNNGR